MPQSSKPSHCIYNGPKDPFTHVSNLGRGGFAQYVDKVHRFDKPGELFARKCFALPPHRDTSSVMDNILKEITVMRKLRHEHLVSFMGSYEWDQNFYVLLDPVAEEDLSTFLTRIDQLSKIHPQRLKASKQLQKWPACLIRALDYIHAMRVRHKDIKPANILLKEGRVYLTDFGIARDFANMTTSGTQGMVEAMTTKYAAPEVVNEKRRGRRADVFSLGCVMLELCTVSLGSPKALEKFELHRRGNGKGRHDAAYSRSPFSLFDWIWTALRSNSDNHLFLHKLLPLVFLMLDPNPDYRITSRQLADLLSDPRCTDFHDLRRYSCENCRGSFGRSAQDIPLHSVFKKVEGTNQITALSKEGLDFDTTNLWEVVKTFWLESHIWWTSNESEILGEEMIASKT